MPPSAPRRTAALAAAVLLLGTACDEPGNPVWAYADRVSGLEVTQFESGFAPDAPTALIPVDGLTDAEADRYAQAAAADVTAYWSAVFPRDFGMAFAPVRRLVSYDSRDQGARTACGPMDAPNAFYCPADDSVVWDRGVLLPRLMQRSHALAPITAIAHEYGHAVQQRLGAKAGIDASARRSILLELQADCFTGGYLRWAVSGKSRYFAISTGDGLNAVLAALFALRDAPGDSAARLGAHGSGFDRAQAFQEGFEQGPKRCAGYTADELKRRSTLHKLRPGDSGDSTIDERHLQLVTETLRYAFADSDARPRVTPSGGTCGGGEPVAARYCPETDTVSANLRLLAGIGTPVEPESGGGSGGEGDFAAWASVASRYALAVQRADGEPIDDLRAGLRSACLVGAWGNAVNRTRERPADHPVMRLSAGDVDEAILELVQPDSLIASDVEGKQVPSGFLRIEAFRTGWNAGPAACATKYSSR